VRDRPAFHEVERPAVVTTPIDGLTDGEWAARNERRGRRIRRALGLALGVVAGLFFGLLSASRLDPGARHYTAAFFLVVGGCVLLFVSLFTSEREREFPEAALWVLAPEWMLLRSMPWWAIALLAALALGGTSLIVVTVIVGQLPWPFA